MNNNSNKGNSKSVDFAWNSASTPVAYDVIDSQAPRLVVCDIFLHAIFENLIRALSGRTMSGQKAFNLLKTYHQSSDRLIPNFNSEDLRGVLEEINVAFQENHQAALQYQESHDKTIFPMIGYRHALLQRNVRCSLAYLYNRLLKLKEIRWHLGPTLTADVKEALTEPEIQWFNNYSKLLANYMMSFPNGVNLTTDLKPPKSLFIEVKCLIDHGKLELEGGEVILLQKDSIHYLPRSECEQLIRQGVLEHIIQ